MLFKKRKEAKELRAKEIEDGRLQVVQQFETAIKKADQMKDPAAKIIALSRISDDIIAQVERENKEIAQKAKSSEKKINYASAAPALGGLAAMFVIAGPIGWACGGAAVASIYGGEFLAGKRKQAVQKKLEEASDAHTKSLYSLAALTTEMAEAIVEKNVEEISKSPLYKRVLDLPGLDEAFAEAAAKHIAAAKEAEAAAAPKETPPVKEEPKANPPKKPADFSRISKLGKQL